MPRPTLIRPLLLALLAAAAVPLAAPVARAQDEDAGAYLAARVADSQSDYREAAAWYARAIGADPANPQLLEGAVLAELGLGNIPAAADHARRLQEVGNVGQGALLALYAELAGNAEFAPLAERIEAGGSVGTLLDKLLIAWARMGEGRMTDALAAFDGMAQTQGLEAFGLYHKALALASAGDFEGADDILSGRAAGPIAVMRRGVIAHVQILSQLERDADALALLDRSFGVDPDPQVDALRAALTGDEPVPFDIVRNAQDGMAEVFFSLASALSGEADAGFTLLYTRIATHLRPDHIDAVLLTAELLERQEQFELAAQTYALVPPDHPAFYVAEVGRADTLIRSDKPDAGIEVLQSLTRTHGSLMGVHLALGDALRREERFAESVPAYDAAIDLIATPQQRHWSVFYARGISHERTGDWPKAEADFRKALTLEPDQPQVLNYLGYSFVDRGENLDEALGMIERAVAAQPDAGYIIDSLAWALFRLGRYQEAVEPMERASLLEPVDPIVTDHLGDVYWAVGRKLEAQFQWHRALSFDPEEKDAIRIRRKLEVGLDQVLQEEGKPPITADTANGG